MKRRERRKKWRGRWVVRLPDGSGGAYRFRSKARAKGYARQIGGTFGRFRRADWHTNPWRKSSDIYGVRAWISIPRVSSAFKRAIAAIGRVR